MCQTNGSDVNVFLCVGQHRQRKTKQYSEPSAGRDRILKFKEVSARVGLSRSHVHQLVTVNKFPKPFKFHEAGRSNGWLESEIDEWIETRVAASRAKGSNHA